MLCVWLCLCFDSWQSPAGSLWLAPRLLWRPAHFVPLWTGCYTYCAIFRKVGVSKRKSTPKVKQNCKQQDAAIFPFFCPTAFHCILGWKNSTNTDGKTIQDRFMKNLVLYGGHCNAPTHHLQSIKIPLQTIITCRCCCSLCTTIMIWVGMPNQTNTALGLQPDRLFTPV